jgi:sucrose-6-phosphate hydrolase SacC (GH32 family)
MPAIDTPILYAAKRMFDGKRHVITGWLRDLGGHKDGGPFQWGGTQSVPREVYAGPNGQLCLRPVPEATAVFTREVLNLAARPQLAVSQTRWGYEGSALVGEAAGGGSQCSFDVPPNYMLKCRLQMEPAATFTVAMREQDEPSSGYRLVLRPAQKEVEINGPGFRFQRRCPIDAGQPVEVQAFVQGSIIECFVNDAYAFSARAYGFAKGKLGLSVAGGKVRLLGLSVRTHEKAS